MCDVDMSGTLGTGRETNGPKLLERSLVGKTAHLIQAVLLELLLRPVVALPTVTLGRRQQRQ